MPYKTKSSCTMNCALNGLTRTALNGNMLSIVAATNVDTQLISNTSKYSTKIKYAALVKKYNY